jgi:hypothetical protein
MPTSTFVEIPEEEQAQMRAALRRARYGYLLALHSVLLCAAGVQGRCAGATAIRAQFC